MSLFGFAAKTEAEDLRRRAENLETLVRLLTSRLAHPDRDWADSILASLDAPELTGPVRPADRKPGPLDYRTFTSGESGIPA